MLINVREIEAQISYVIWIYRGISRYRRFCQGAALAAKEKEVTLVIYPGMYLPYVSKTAVLNFLISNLFVVLPMVLFKGRQMVKNDITEY